MNLTTIVRLNYNSLQKNFVFSLCCISGLGIPEMHPTANIPMNPSRPQPPCRPPLPATSPSARQKLPIRKAGVISIPSQEMIPAALIVSNNVEANVIASPSLSNVDASQIYEEIDEDAIVSCPEPREPPPPPPRPEQTLPPLPQRFPGSLFRTPPPIPARSAPPPPLPARPR